VDEISPLEFIAIIGCGSWFPDWYWLLIGDNCFILTVLRLLSCNIEFSTLLPWLIVVMLFMDMSFVELVFVFSVVLSVAATALIVRNMHSIIPIKIILFCFLIITPPVKTP
jgi:hypothetical protein